MDLLECRFFSGVLTAIIGFVSIIVGIIAPGIELTIMFYAGGGILLMYGISEAVRYRRLIKIVKRKTKEIQRKKKYS